MIAFHPFDQPPVLPADELRQVMGGKGAGLARMTALGIPVPPGFVLPTSACRQYLQSGWSDDFAAAVVAGLHHMSTTMGRALGDPARPLIVSVRSGAAESMPGMMDTLLNVGMTPAIAAAMSAASGDAAFGWETYHRFVSTYAELVLGASPDLVATLHAPAVPSEMSARAAIAALHANGLSIPEDPEAQVIAAVQTVFASWNSPRANTYRSRQGIAEDLGTAAVVQAMVFGNRGPTSGTGVAFSRNPSTGEAGLMGDFLSNAQGEDVVAGTHATQPLAEMAFTWPDVAASLETVAATLEHEYRDMVDLEFTVEDGTLWLLQCRTGKRTAHAALRTAVDMANDPAFPLSRADAVDRVASILLHPPTERAEAASPSAGDEPMVLAEGLGASPGVAVGVVSIDIDDTVKRAGNGEPVILIRPTTSPADVHGMAEAVGFVTTTGGLVSHAALVAREWGLPAVVGVAALTITATGIAGPTAAAAVGDTITVDGDRGVILIGAHPVATVEPPEVAVLRGWQAEVAGHTPLSVPSSTAQPATAAALAVAAAVADTAVAPMAAITSTEVLRVLSIKGMATAATAAALTGTDEATVGKLFSELIADDLIQELPGDRVRLTKAGSAAGLAMYAEEADHNATTIEPSMPEFHRLNNAFKELITDWQMREVNGETVPNDHTDAEYDNAIFDRLDVIDAGIGPIVDTVSHAVPRLARYRSRFTAALAAVRAGDPQMMAHPLKDSYHTVWFELHEELIRLTNRNRADEQ